MTQPLAGVQPHFFDDKDTFIQGSLAFANGG